MAYNHKQGSRFTVKNCEAQIGREAELPLTGKIIDAGESMAGAYVRFQVDERWGFGPHFTMCVDLDALEVTS